jgi:hypothetical protein
MSRDEVIAANPITDFVRSCGHELKRAGSNFVTSGCPATQHKRGHRPVMIYPKTQSWNCHDCKVGGTVIDWVMREKKVTAAEAMRELAGGLNVSELSSLILREYNAAWKHAHDRGLPPPPPPVSERTRDEVVIRVTRSERRIGGRWKDADGRVFEEDESGMVYAFDSRGERIVDPTFRRGRRPTNEPADE